MCAMNIERRIATEDDLDTLYDINVRAMKGHILENFGVWDDEEQCESFKNSTDGHSHVLLLQNSRPIGFVHIFQSESGIHLNRICIVPEHQGTGIGTAIIQEVISSNTQGRPIMLQVFPNNPARDLYYRLGFRETKRTTTHIHMAYASGNE
jgi:ribosomal protein S18 acetylase RimI-like enzyme